jgi:histidinol-phosphate aminotransferase
MTISRRAFVRTLGWGSTGILSGAFVAARGREALAWAGEGAMLARAVATEIQLDSNENPNGPGAAVLDAVRGAFGIACRYPHNWADLTDALAALHGVKPENILLGAGSGEVLRMAVFAYTSPARPLVAGSPTFEEPGRHAEVAGTPVRAVPVDAELRLDLNGMAQQALGAGVVYLCNPNNPTATLHSGQAVTDFVARVAKASPETVVLVDEAYHHYVEASSYASAIPLALERPRLLVTRTFSKVYGLAGLRVGYAIARADTLEPMRRHKLPNSINALGAAAALAALEQKDRVERERRLNREAREFTRRALEADGFKVIPSEANFLMADVRRDPQDFRDACQKLGVLVGRPFPPLKTHARISIGTMDEMRQAVDVFRKVLGVSVTL